ncbi:MAG: hypothetical protein ACLP0J_09005 [Solirubrobacteraceae bacterium]
MLALAHLAVRTGLRVGVAAERLDRLAVAVGAGRRELVGDVDLVRVLGVRRCSGLAAAFARSSAMIRRTASSSAFGEASSASGER